MSIIRKAEIDGQEVLFKLIELWGLNVQTDVEAKKNFVRQNGK